MNAKLGPYTDHEARIDAAERQMLQANNRTDREMFCRAFLQAIAERNAERTTDQVQQIEASRGLR
jgi:hypothetical protein